MDVVSTLFIVLQGPLIGWFNTRLVLFLNIQKENALTHTKQSSVWVSGTLP